MTEAKKNRLLKKIDQLKKILRREKATFGGYHDGSGYRYSIAEYYFDLGDYKKTNRYLNWFDKAFPNDGKYFHYELGEAVTKFEVGKLKEAKLATIGLNSHNTYMIDLILGNEVTDQNKYEWMEAESLNWANENVNKHLLLTTENYVKWLSNFRKELQYEQWYTKYISIKRLLKGLDVGEERTSLLKAGYKCLSDWQEDMTLKNKK